MSLSKLKPNLTYLRLQLFEHGKLFYEFKNFFGDKACSVADKRKLVGTQTLIASNFYIPIGKTLPAIKELILQDNLTAKEFLKQFCHLLDSNRPPVELNGLLLANLSIVENQQETGTEKTIYHLNTFDTDVKFSRLNAVGKVKFDISDNLTHSPFDKKIVNFISILTATPCVNCDFDTSLGNEFSMNATQTCYKLNKTDESTFTYKQFNPKHKTFFDVVISQDGDTTQLVKSLARFMERVEIGFASYSLTDFNLDANDDDNPIEFLLSKYTLTMLEDEPIYRYQEADFDYMFLNKNPNQDREEFFDYLITPEELLADMPA